MRSPLLTWLCFAASTAAFGVAAEARDGVDYATQIAPLFRKYCLACHNDSDREGKLSLESFDALSRGGEHGAVLVPNNSGVSRLIRVIRGDAAPKMPPKDNDAPTENELAILAAWIDGGAKGPDGTSPDPTRLVTPKIAVRGNLRQPIYAVAITRQGNRMATAMFRQVDVLATENGERQHQLPSERGNINNLSFDSSGDLLVAAGGEPGLVGEAQLWDLRTGKLVRSYLGHRDSLYSARLSPDGKILATAGYDQKIKLWETDSGKELRTLDGHNGPVFDLAFHPSGRIMATASGDRTVKLWSVATGERLDTLNQSQQELYCVQFSPDGRAVTAAGADNRIRIWSVSETAREGTNPLRISQFAHELPVIRLAYSPDGRTLASAGEDRLVKIWDAETMQIRATLPPQSDWPVGLAIDAQGASVLVGRLDGSFGRIDIPTEPIQVARRIVPQAEVPPSVDYGPQPTIDQLVTNPEIEPNNQAGQATPLSLPGKATGTIHTDASGKSDMDLFRFAAKAGEQWIFETNAGRKNSPLDTKLEILTTDGKPVPRVLLRAVRDSEIEFRGIDSNQRGARLKNWEEMYLNEYVYINGEVIKHYQQRRGPDADSQFYPENGNRTTFFETSSRAHPLGQPGYVVVPYPVGTQLPDNGLPTFVVHFENDDDAQRKLGKDSRLTFLAPADGEYLAKVSDVRGETGPSFAYELIVRRPQPDFTLTVGSQSPTVPQASGKSFVVRADRIDNFMGPIQIDVTGVPKGYAVTSPIVIQEGLNEAKGVINALTGSAPPTELESGQLRFLATAQIAGKSISKEIGGLGMIKQADKPKLIVHLEIDPENPASRPGRPGSDSLTAPEPPQVTIVPGRRTTAKLRIERLGFNDRVQLEIENLPHGVIVDDIGLNGILIPEGQTERTIFLACEPWVPATTRLFFAVAKVEGDQASLPMQLIVSEKTTP